MNPTGEGAQEELDAVEFHPVRQPEGEVVVVHHSLHRLVEGVEDPNGIDQERQYLPQETIDETIHNPHAGVLPQVSFPDSCYDFKKSDDVSNVNVISWHVESFSP